MPKATEHVMCAPSHSSSEGRTLRMNYDLELCMTGGPGYMRVFGDMDPQVKLAGITAGHLRSQLHNVFFLVQWRTKQHQMLCHNKHTVRVGHALANRTLSKIRQLIKLA